ncbi:hypothetical protein BpHYR1_043658, partial [Brachionus plicatilis]
MAFFHNSNEVIDRFDLIFVCLVVLDKEAKNNKAKFKKILIKTKTCIKISWQRFSLNIININTKIAKSCVLFCSNFKKKNKKIGILIQRDLFLSA